MKKNILNTVMLVSVLALAGCGLFGKKDHAAGSSTTSGADSSGGSGYNSETPPGPVEIGGDAGSGGAGAGSELAPGAPPVSGQPQLTDHTVYFEFDSSEMNDAGKKVVAAYGQYLSSNPATKLRLEGHADERGTREYNVGLGERRANTVLQALLNAGATAAQMSVTSYGEERPADPGHTEASWAKNRRVEITR